MIRNDTSAYVALAAVLVTYLVVASIPLALSDVEEHTETKTLIFEPWKEAPDVDQTNKFLDDGWRIKDIQGDGCCYFEITIVRTQWRLKR